jgi:hypothetical protein
MTPVSVCSSPAGGAGVQRPAIGSGVTGLLAVLAVAVILGLRLLGASAGAFVGEGEGSNLPLPGSLAGAAVLQVSDPRVQERLGSRMLGVTLGRGVGVLRVRRTPRLELGLSSVLGDLAVVQERSVGGEDGVGGHGPERVQALVQASNSADLRVDRARILDAVEQDDELLGLVQVGDMAAEVEVVDVVCGRGLRAVGERRQLGNDRHLVVNSGTRAVIASYHITPGLAEAASFEERVDGTKELGSKDLVKDSEGSSLPVLELAVGSLAQRLPGLSSHTKVVSLHLRLQQCTSSLCIDLGDPVGSLLSGERLLSSRTSRGLRGDRRTKFLKSDGGCVPDLSESGRDDLDRVQRRSVGELVLEGDS